MYDGDSWWVDTIEALALPVAALLGLLLLRKPLAAFLNSIGGRVSKLNVPWLGSIELAPATELRPDWLVASHDGTTHDVRRLVPALVFDSNADTLLDQLAGPDELDYAVVDLGTGTSWLTTRLFLFAELLPRMRNLQAFVFVHTVGQTERRHLGVADPRTVRWVLAERHPELDRTFANAYQQHFLVDPANGATASYPRHVTSQHGALSRRDAAAIARRFLESLQRTQPPVDPDAEWIGLDDPPQSNVPALWERASWIDGPGIERLLGHDLSKAAIDERDDADIRRADQVEAVVAASGRFVAITQNRRFARLLDRTQILELVARRAIDQRA